MGCKMDQLNSTINEVETFRLSTSPFDLIRRTDANGASVWSARELMPFLGYPVWRNMNEVIDRAKLACVSRNMEVGSIFAPGIKKSGPGRPAVDVLMKRLGCYLVAMNGDPSKYQVADAQMYFADSTRKYEVALAEAIKPEFAPTSITTLGNAQLIDSIRLLSAQVLQLTNKINRLGSIDKPARQAKPPLAFDVDYFTDLETFIWTNYQQVLGGHTLKQSVADLVWANFSRDVRRSDIMGTVRKLFPKQRTTRLGPAETRKCGFANVERINL